MNSGSLAQSCLSYSRVKLISQSLTYKSTISFKLSLVFLKAYSWRELCTLSPSGGCGNQNHSIRIMFCKSSSISPSILLKCFKIPVVVFPSLSSFKLIVIVLWFLLSSGLSWNFHPNVFPYIYNLKQGNFCFTKQYLKCMSVLC